MVNKQGEANMTTTRLLNKVLEQAAVKGIGREAALNMIASMTDRDGLYESAKRWGVLINESAADFACEFYATFNNEIYYRY
jgi:phage portal protein BeeE